MKPRILVYLLIITAVFPTHADAGGLLRASYDGCVSQLGAFYKHDLSEVPPATDCYAFKHNGRGIAIHFWEGRAHCITYLKLDGTPLNDSDVSALLASYGGGQRWRKAEGFLLTADETVVAKQSMAQLTFYTTEFLKAASQ